MALKQATGLQAPDGSYYVTLADGAGNLAPAASSGGGVVTNAGTFAVQNTAATPAGANVIGHVITDTGSTTVVTGTVAVTESGTWTVQPGNTANTTAWKVDGSAVTQPVSLASVPSHAVTNAGTFAVQNTAVNPATNTYTGNVSTEGTKATYSVQVSALALAASATDILTITGSATKTVRVTRISFTGTATALGDNTVLLVRRSTANTGGTSSSLTPTTHDTNNAAVTATALSYTANPTLGTTLGYLRTAVVPFYAAASAVTPTTWDFTTRNGQGIVLRGTSQVLALNLNGVTITGGILYADIEWTEE